MWGSNPSNGNCSSRQQMPSQTPPSSLQPCKTPLDVSDMPTLPANSFSLSGMPIISDFMLHGSDIQRMLEGQLRESTMRMQLLQGIAAQPGQGNTALPQVQMQPGMPTGVHTGMQLGLSAPFQSMKSQVPPNLVSHTSSDIRFPCSMLSPTFSESTVAANNQQAAAAPSMQPRIIPVGSVPLPSQLQAHKLALPSQRSTQLLHSSSIKNQGSSSPKEMLPLRKQAPHLNSYNQAEGLGSTSDRPAKRQHMAKVFQPESMNNKVQGSSTKTNLGSSNESGQSHRNNHENAAEQVQCQPTSADGGGSGGTDGSRNNQSNIKICTNNNSTNADELEGTLRPCLGSSPHKSCCMQDDEGVKRKRNCYSSGADEIQHADDGINVNLNHHPSGGQTTTHGGGASCSGGDTNSEGISSRQEDSCHRPKGQKRLFWTPELHQRFLQAMFQLGVNNAAPKYIMQIMSVEGLKRENVGSHLQRYKQYLKRIAGVSPKANITPDQLQQAQSVVMRDHARKSGLATANAALPSQPPLGSSMDSSMSASACSLIRLGNFGSAYNPVPANFPAAATVNPVLAPQSHQLPLHLQTTLYPPVAPFVPPLTFSQLCLPIGLASMQQRSTLGAAEQQTLLASLHQQIRMQQVQLMQQQAQLDSEFLRRRCSQGSEQQLQPQQHLLQQQLLSQQQQLPALPQQQLPALPQQHLLQQQLLSQQQQQQQVQSLPQQQLPALPQQHKLQQQLLSQQQQQQLLALPQLPALPQQHLLQQQLLSQQQQQLPALPQQHMLQQQVLTQQQQLPALPQQHMLQQQLLTQQQQLPALPQQHMLQQQLLTQQQQQLPALPQQQQQPQQHLLQQQLFTQQQQHNHQLPAQPQQQLPVLPQQHLLQQQLLPQQQQLPALPQQQGQMSSMAAALAPPAFDQSQMQTRDWMSQMQQYLESTPQLRQSNKC